jgi:nucleotide-binding universal stress UspA family protein
MTARKILVATDFSTHSDKALSEALGLAEKEMSPVFLLHVVPDDLIQCVELYCLDEEQMQAVQAQSMQTAREKMVEQLGRQPLAQRHQIEPVVTSGKASEAILEFGESHNVDLIVLGAYGRRGVTRFLAGSTARDVLKGAKSSVLVVR